MANIYLLIAISDPNESESESGNNSEDSVNSNKNDRRGVYVRSRDTPRRSARILAMQLGKNL